MRAKLIWMLKILVFALFMATAAAQVPAEIEFGVRGGLLINDPFQLSRSCCRYTGPPAFTSEHLRGTVGPTVGVLLFDRAEVRFEAVHKRFEYRTEFTSTASGPGFITHEVTTTRGYSWEFPLLATYRFGQGKTRPFAGGGISLGGKTRATLDFQNTYTRPSPEGPITTTTTGQSPTFPLASSAYYIVGGVDGRIRYFSIRPELRYTRVPVSGDTAFNSSVIDTRNQFEFVIGLSIHPFRSR